MEQSCAWMDLREFGYRDCKCVQSILAKTPSGGSDMEVSKAMLFYYVILSNIYLGHSSTCYCDLTTVNGKKTHQ